MGSKSKLNLFISYSHEDENHINEFRKHISVLVQSQEIEIWHDREIAPGEKFDKIIEGKIECSDIICFFISANFLNSQPCSKEVKQALKLRNQKGITIVPIILSECGWKDKENIKTFLALPIDGQPIDSFENKSSAWNNVYEGLKKTLEKINKIKQLKINKEFLSFLQSSDLLEKSHPNKEKVLLDDIFVPPFLSKYNREREVKYEKDSNFEEILKKLHDYKKILISGEDQSGKTALCKRIFTYLRDKNFIPIYIRDPEGSLKGKIENRIHKYFKEQYTNGVFQEIDCEYLVPIIDDFHLANQKSKHINDLSKYNYTVLTTDDILDLSLDDKIRLREFAHFSIKEFRPSLRDKLIRKWIRLTDKEKNVSISAYCENEMYQKIDETTELVNGSLGKLIGKGIMPAYPFFILSIINYYEIGKPLDEKITSQGYCYQGLIYFYLRKCKVKNDEIDTYINFLSVFAFQLFKDKKGRISKDDFSTFMQKYLDKYNLPIAQKTLLKNLRPDIISIDSFGNSSFTYPYLYYFFVAKYLTNHEREEKEVISNILKGLHKNEDAYIAIFLFHHSSHENTLNEVLDNGKTLFGKYGLATLKKDYLTFLDEQFDKISHASSLKISSNPEQTRNKHLQKQDKLEEMVDDEDNDVSNTRLETRRAIKTIEVMGCILKNRSGSLEKVKLENLFREALHISLRVMDSIVILIQEESKQEEMIDYIADILRDINKKKRKSLNRKDLSKKARIIFWNINFVIIYGLLNKIVHSLGSNKLIKVVKKICDDENTPASFIIKHGISMWYDKSLDPNEIEGLLKRSDFSQTAKVILKYQVLNHCSTHKIKYKDQQLIENKLKLRLPYNKNQET